MLKSLEKIKIFFETSKGKIWKQIWRDFKWPAVISIAWSIINMTDGSVGSLNEVLPFFKNFGPAFFFISWMISQYWRVSKQIGVETNFQNVEERLNQLVGHVTGGDSYFYLVLEKQVSFNSFRAVCKFEGDYTLQDCKIVVLTAELGVTENVSSSFPSLNKGLVHKASRNITIELKGAKIEVLTVIYESLDKTWFQIFSFQRVQNKLKVNSKLIPPGKAQRLENYEIDYSDSKKEWEIL